MTKPSKFAQPFRGFEILDRLGSGGMGTVFKARRKADDALVALKVLRPSLSRNARYVERLRREAEISMRLDHAGLVKGYGLGEEGGYHYLVMEFVSGRSLKSLLKTWGRFPEEQVLELGMQMAEALAYAHEHGVVHRDVKPGNIIVNEEDRAKLTDLGLAKGETDPTLTRDGATVGTPQYMSPEQAQDPGMVDERSDLYSLGATLYHMAVGLPPFEGESVVQVISKLLHERADSAGSLNPEVSTGLSLILRRLLAKDPALRYQTARELLVDLERVDQGETPAVDVRVLARAEGRSDLGPSRTKILVAGSVVLGLAGAAWLLTHHGGRVDQRPSGLRGLRVAVADAQRGFAERLELIDEFDPDDDQRPVVSTLRQAVLREFGRAMRDFQRRFDSTAVEGWVDKHGLAVAPQAFATHVDAKLQTDPQFRGYVPETLPPTIEPLYRIWLDGRVRDVAARIQSRCARLAAEIRENYDQRIAPELAKLAAAGEFRQADQQLTRLIERPSRCGVNGSRTAGTLPQAETARLSALTKRLQETQRGLRQRARELVDAWRTLVAAPLEEARTYLATGHVRKARTALAAARRAFEAPKSWRTLPSSVDSPVAGLRSQLSTATRALDETTRRLDFDALAECEDAIHRVIARSYDLDEAERLLDSYRFEDADARDEKTRIGQDLAALRQAVHVLLDAAAASRSRRWILREDRLDATLARVVRGPTPGIVLRSGGQERTVRLADFDPTELVKLVSRAQQEVHRIGLGLFLFFGDRFSEAAVLLQNHRGGRLRAMKSRRLVELKNAGQRIETRAKRLLQRLERFVATRDPGFRHLELTENQLETLEADYARTRVVREAKEKLQGFRAIIARERLRRSLLGRLPEDLAERLEMSLRPDGDGFSLRLGLSFAGDPFLGASGWRAAAGGIMPPAASGQLPWVEIERAWQVALPVIEPTGSATLTVEFQVPGGGRKLDALLLNVFGSRILLLQMPDQEGLVSTDVPGNLRQALVKAYRNRRPAATPWFLLRGASYTLRIALGPVQNLHRVCNMRLNDVEIAGAKAMPAARARRDELKVAAVGGFLLEEIRLEATARR